MIEIADAMTVKNDDKLSVGIVGEVTPNTISVDYRPPIHIDLHKHEYDQCYIA